MKKILTALIAATIFSAIALVMSDTADARWGYGGYRGVGYRGFAYRGYAYRGLRVSVIVDQATAIVVMATLVTVTVAVMLATAVTATVAAIPATATVVTAMAAAMPVTATLATALALRS